MVGASGSLDKKLLLHGPDAPERRSRPERRPLNLKCCGRPATIPGGPRGSQGRAKRSRETIAHSRPQEKMYCRTLLVLELYCESQVGAV